MPFGLVNVQTTFQRAMDLVLSGLSYMVCLCYLDDIVFGRDFTEHYEMLTTVLERLRSHKREMRTRFSALKTIIMLCPHFGVP